MGCGASGTRNKQPHINVQVPPTSHSQPPPTSHSQPPTTSHSQPPPSNLTLNKPTMQGLTQQREERSQQQQDQLKWPLPPKEQEKSFELKRNLDADKERYSIQSSYDAEVSPRIQSPPVTLKSKTQLHQKEMSSTQWNKGNSSISESAHVQSTLQTQSHSCINLSTSEEVSRLMIKLNGAHTRLDDIVRRRLANVSKETEKILEKIGRDTELEQQDLLLFAKQRQTRQDELYQEWLQKYIAVLDEWKSAKLAKLQEELQTNQRKIIESSQRKITAVNKQVTVIKRQILADEQQRASSIIETLIAQIESLSTHETLQFLGSETMTNINVIVQSNVGRKAAGQTCKFKFEGKASE